MRAEKTLDVESLVFAKCLPFPDQSGRCLSLVVRSGFYKNNLDLGMLDLWGAT
jgi:hypothetical protein